MGSVEVGIPFADYLKIDACSAHGLMLIERSPAHYRASIEAPRAPTPAQALGTLAHLLILEPDREASEVAVAPAVDGRTKAGKEAKEAFARESEGKLIVTKDDMTKARAMRESVMAQPYARALLEDGQAESTLLWKDHETGLNCKARPDWLCGGHAVTVDLKTACDASPDGFAKASGQYTYHMQSGHYTDAAIACGLGERTFVFIVVETEPPYAVGLYQLDAEAIFVGRQRIRRALETYARCRESGEWPGYATEIKTLSLPKWAL